MFEVSQILLALVYDKSLGIEYRMQLNINACTHSYNFASFTAVLLLPTRTPISDPPPNSCTI